MALTEEQRAMLQLLLEGGQGYDDIASLLGTSGDEVRTRARGALREMGGADPDTQVPLSDFLLGQADPIGRADAVRHLQNDPKANDLAARLISQLRLIAPQADLPQIPPAKGGRAPAPSSVPQGSAAPQGPGAASGTAGAPRSREALPGRITGAVRGAGSTKRGGQMLAIGLGAALLLIVGILAIAGVFGGGDDGSSGDDAAAATASAGNGEGLTIVDLKPVSGDTGASGQAVFAQTQDQPVLQINLTGLEPSNAGQTYIAWLYSSESAAFPLARDQVTDDGNLTGAAAIPTEIIPLLGQFGCVDVSLASDDQTQDALKQAVKGKSLPRHTGETVLRGQIPSGPGATAASGADSQCRVTSAASGGGNGGGKQGN